MGAIALYARAGAHFEARMAHAVALLQSAAAEHPGAIVQATSLGAEDMVITDLIARHQLPIEVATLDTGMLHAQTLALIPQIESRYGLSVRRYKPTEQAVLQSAAAEHAGAVVQATSLGAEDMVITDLIARHQLPIEVATLDTGMLHAQTLALIPQIESRYGLSVRRYKPTEQAVLHFVRDHGERPMHQSIELRKACCALRKLQPLAQMLDGRSAWVTGLRREQSANRGGVPFSERDGDGRIKFNPLSDWSWADVWHYIATHGVPYNELHDQFFPSIGCEPCTRAIAVGEDFRSGRWWWEDEKAKECGLHVAKNPEEAHS